MALLGVGEVGGVINKVSWEQILIVRFQKIPAFNLLKLYKKIKTDYILLKVLILRQREAAALPPVYQPTNRNADQNHTPINTTAVLNITNL